MMHHPNFTSLLLVNEKDEIVGTAEKMAVHQTGDLHRAFSVLIFDENGRFLLQQRALCKYHSGGLWSNTCCGHPTQPDNTANQAEQRLYEEMGFRVSLQPLFHFQYYANLPNGLIEHELDHVFTGRYAGTVPFNPDEVQAVRWISPDDLLAEMTANPDAFTAWFHKLVPQLKGTILP